MSSNQPIQTAKFKVNIIKPYQLPWSGNTTEHENFELGPAGQTVRKLLKSLSSTSKLDDDVLFQGQKASPSPRNGE